ncbi:phosphoribosylformylglycinamidine synthase subunit PurS [bacterium]|nr:phosphoribosylformylglycinamidine synthase subunit PurS [bacterium]NUN45149.1 phosphoribosylformylglycinamidine synthase subunit PurS [bacterium]
MLCTIKIKVTPKAGVLDPQGKVVMSSLETLGFNGIDDVRLGRYIEIKMEASSKEDAARQADTMCQKLLANLVIEQYQIEVA